MSLKSLVNKARGVSKAIHSGIPKEDVTDTFNDVVYNIDLRTPKKEAIIETLKGLLEQFESTEGEAPEHLIKTLIMEAFSIAYSQDSRAVGVFHPSEYASDKKTCHRKMYYQYAHVKKDASFIPITNDNKLQRLFDLGTMMHLYIQYNLQKAGVLKDFETPVVSKEYGLSGKADGIVSFVGFDHWGKFYNKEDMVLEVKTMFSFGFSKLKEPNRVHVKQASIYGHFLGLDKIAFVYYCKDNSDMKIFIVDIDHDYVVNEYKKDASAVINKYNTNVRKTRSKKAENHTDVPDRICVSRTSSVAVDCPYADFCFKSN